MRLNFNEEQGTTEFIDEAIVYRTESKSEPGYYHYTLRFRNGDIVCSCKGFQYGEKCWHMDRFEMDGNGYRILQGWEGPTTRNQALVLGVLSKHPATARDKDFWPLNYNQVRGLLTRLRAREFVTQTGFSHSSHIYSITPQGMEALRAYGVTDK
jgi:hypothetical protein